MLATGHGRSFLWVLAGIVEQLDLERLARPVAGFGVRAFLAERCRARPWVIALKSVDCCS